VQVIDLPTSGKSITGLGLSCGLYRDVIDRIALHLNAYIYTKDS